MDNSYYFDTVLINFDCHGGLMMGQHAKIVYQETFYQLGSVRRMSESKNAMKALLNQHPKRHGLFDLDNRRIAFVE